MEREANVASSGKVRFGILGCGFIARAYHMPALRQLEEAELVAFSNGQNLGPAVELARVVGLDVDACHTNADDVFARPDVDAVLILTPNDTHLELVLAAARAGKHALVQKPFARTSAECRKMIAAAQAAGTVLAASFMHRYFPEVHLAREYIGRELLGRLHTIRLRNAVPFGNWTSWFHRRERTGGGAAIDVGVHGIDLIRYWTSCEIESVQAQVATFLPKRRLNLPGQDETVVEADNEDNVLALYQLEGGALGAHEISWTESSPPRRFEAELRGEDGVILIRSGLGSPLAVSSRKLENNNRWITPFLPYEPFGVRQHKAFLDAVLGRAPLETPGEDGLATVQVVEALYRSAEVRGCPVTVERIEDGSDEG